MTQDFCTNNGYTPFENAVQEAIADLVPPELAQPISTRVGTLHRADLAPQAGSVDVEAVIDAVTSFYTRKEDRNFAAQVARNTLDNLLAGAPVGGDRPAIPGLQKAQGWQTVENVPRDQDVLVGYLNHAGEVEDVSVAYVSEGEKYHINSIYAEPRGDCRHCGGACKRVYVTHWMPLPAAPRDGRD